MKLTLGPFQGARPAFAPKYLPSNAAAICLDCDLSNGQVAPAKVPTAAGVSLSQNTKTLHWFNREANGGAGYWLQFGEDVDVVRGPLVDDTNLRTYITGDGVPKYTTAALAQGGAGPYPAAARQLGLPVPPTPTAEGPSGTPPAGGQKVPTSYVVTYISDLGEEGPTSFPSNTVERWDDAAVTLTGLAPASGQFVLVSIRIYRVELNGVYQYVADVPISASTFSDTINTEELGEIVPSAEWVAPNPNMRGLVALPGGLMAGFWGNTIAFCEPNYPHAWPIKYRIALEFNVVAMAVSAVGLIVGTTGAPYLIAGSDPSSMQQVKMELAAACVSKRSMVDMGAFVLYAGADGLYAAGGADARLITAGDITPEQWRAKYNPAQIQAVRWGEKYLAFYPGGAFSFTPEEGFRDFVQGADCTFLDEATGTIYLKVGTALYRWWDGAAANYVYRSKTFLIARGEFAACAKVDADSYPVTLKIYADGALTKTVVVPSRRAFRLPALKRYDEFFIELSGSARVNFVYLADHMGDLP